MKVKGAGTERRKEIKERKGKKERKERGRGGVVVWEGEKGEKKKKLGEDNIIFSQPIRWWYVAR